MTDDTHSGERADRLFDAALDAVQTDVPEAAAEEATFARVSAAIEAQGTGVPADYLAMIPEYLSNRLSPAQRMLFEEEAKSSVPLRRAIGAARRAGGSNAASAPGAGTDAANERRPYLRWAVAASVVVAVITAALALVPELPRPDQSQLVQVKSIEGRLFRVESDGLAAVMPGTWIDGGQQLRTPRDSSVIMTLDDGSRVELDERSQLSVVRYFAGNRIHVNRGRIFVQASPQGSGTLEVITNEFRVSVTGTMFGVRHGARGSRVSVVEGEVQVYRTGDSTALYPGDQLDSRTDDIAQNISDAIAWSQDADRYVAMLTELNVLNRDLSAVMQTDPRFSTRLLDLAPADTAIYAAVPNAPEKIADAFNAIRERMTGGEELRKVWEQVFTSEHEAEIVTMATWLSEVGQLLEDETVFAVRHLASETETHIAPFVMSELRSGVTIDDVQQLADQLQSRVADNGLDVIVMADPSGAVDDTLSILVTDGLLVAAFDPDTLNTIASTVAGSGNPFVGSEYHQLLQNAYIDGTEYLASANVEQLITSSPDDAATPLAIMGADNARFGIIERYRTGDRATTTADLYFDGERHGIAAWLAEPSAIGSLEFFSPDTTLVSASLIKDPVAMFDELVANLPLPEDGVDPLARFQDQSGFHLRDDFLASLGGDVAIGLDGPAFPLPAWKIVGEVYNADLLQATIELMIERINRDALDELGHEVVNVAETDIGYELTVSISNRLEPSAAPHTIDIDYAFVGGYVIAAPTTTLIERAINTYESGASVTTSPDFQSLLPTDGYLDFSALAYLRINDLFGGALSGLGSLVLDDEQKSSIAAIGESAGASLSVAYGEPERIRLIANTPGNFPLTDLSGMLGLTSIVQAISIISGEGMPDIGALEAMVDGQGEAQ